MKRKENKFKPNQPSKKNPKKNNSESVIIFGHYRRNKNQEYVAVGNKQYIVKQIKTSIDSPIANNALVKALVKNPKTMQVKILKVLPQADSVTEKIDRQLAEAEITKDFPKAIHQEANLFGARVSEKDIKGRTDLRKLALCTIDGETAKDFDDAVFAQRKGKNIEVTVAIADVSHYVKIGSALDQEAYTRGTSIYYPGHCVPMLPEQLSNGLCSLKPGVDRLALSVSFELGPKGGISKVKINESVIHSHARLTYNQVQDFYEKGEKADLKLAKNIKQSLKELKCAAEILRKNRNRKGAIDFDIVESNIALDDQGEPISINPIARLDSHRIIEDLMVATNEIVAQFFDKKKIPSIYRVHEPPNQEKLENFFTAAHAFGAIRGGIKTAAAHVKEPKDLQKIILSFESSAYKETLSTLMLRAMMQARYAEKNLKHFGLASDAYLHFTSPIRRYADLVVHRQLRYVLFEKNHKKILPEAMMANISTSITQKEVRATDLERKIHRLYSSIFMAEKIGQSFLATIVSCTEFGLFVRVIEHHVEGLVHISTISKHRVNYIPERMCLSISGSNETFAVGQKVHVKLVSVNVDRGHIDFTLDNSTRELAPKNEAKPKKYFKRKAKTKSPKR